MKNKTEKIQQLIHNSGAFGIFMEIGAGQLVSQTIFEQEGASKLLALSFCPYGIEIQKELFDKSRAVSRERIEMMLNSCDEINFLRGKVNLFFVSSITLSKEKETHGWIGVRYFDDNYIFHFSINLTLSRQELMTIIQDIGIDILYSVVFQEIKAIDYIDVALLVTDEKTEILFNFLDDYWKDDLVSVFVAPDGGKNADMMTLNDFLYSEKKDSVLVAYKGSFNPLHIAHEDILNKTYNKLVSSAKKAFVISYNTLSKETTRESLFERIKNINRRGYNVIVLNNPYFLNNYQTLIANKSLKQIVFPMGSDTYERFVYSDLKQLADQDCIKLYIYNRQSHPFKKIISTNIKYIMHFNNPISSTKIRKHENNA